MVLSQFKVLVREEETVSEVIKKMSDQNLTNGFYGLAVVVDEKNRVLGTLSDGDIRKYLVDSNDLSVNIKTLYNRDPVCVDWLPDPGKMHRSALKCLEKRQKNNKNSYIDQILLLKGDRQFHDIVLLNELLETPLNKHIAIYGMGYVGLTLGLIMANQNYRVTCVDKNKEVIDGLKNNRPHFFENGLVSLLESTNDRNLIKFTHETKAVPCDVYIVAVGTPIDGENQPDMSAIKMATKDISHILKKADLVIYRSTLPVGTIRKVIIPILEECNLKAGEDFHVAFAPERTIEGNALEELRTLPQVIGGYSNKCTDLAASIFSIVTPFIIKVAGLEAAELVKLMNNTFRDLVFSFANEIANICEQYNINAFQLIEAANEGYPRNKIPKPSPGVGGLCLSKDPYLYSIGMGKNAYQPLLGKASREINKKGGQYVYQKIRKYCEITRKNVDDIQVLIVGLAFKGMPETSDIRDSMAIKLIELLPSNKNIFVKDFVVPQHAIEELAVQSVSDLKQGMKDKDMVIFMNNHYLSHAFDLFEYFSLLQPDALIFDGWNLFQPNQVEVIQELYYATMGYMTVR